MKLEVAKDNTLVPEKKFKTLENVGYVWTHMSICLSRDRSRRGRIFATCLDRISGGGCKANWRHLRRRLSSSSRVPFSSPIPSTKAIEVPVAAMTSEYGSLLFLRRQTDATLFTVLQTGATKSGTYDRKSERRVCRTNSIGRLSRPVGFRCVFVLTGDYHYSDLKVFEPGSGAPYAQYYPSDAFAKPVYQVTRPAILRKRAHVVDDSSCRVA